MCLTSAGSSTMLMTKPMAVVNLSMLLVTPRRCRRKWKVMEAMEGDGRQWTAVEGSGRQWKAAAGSAEYLARRRPLALRQQQSVEAQREDSGGQDLRGIECKSRVEVRRLQHVALALLEAEARRREQR